MKKYFLSILICVYMFSIITLKAEIKLPAIFGDNMVLQQRTDVLIWGKASLNKTVTIFTSWNNKSYTTNSDKNGNWKIKLRTSVAGGPYEMNISDGDSVKLHNIMIGEVWVCSGQSNMQMPMKGYPNQPVLGSNEAIATSGNELIRLFTVKHEKKLEPQDNFNGQWKECVPENIADFSATSYFFGRLVQKALGVPVGLICSSWGGTRIEPWISENGLKKFDWVRLPNKDMEGDFSQQTPTVLFNAMIKPMVGYTIKGALWYQGESNRNEPEHYAALLSRLIEDWRARWGIGDFPFYYMQIAPFGYPSNGLNSAFLREAQLEASKIIPNSGMACLMDIGEQDCIHPSHKHVVGERLAYLALAKTYGIKGFEYSGPVLKDIKVIGSLVELTFQHANNGLTTFGKDLVNFKIAGQDRHFYPALASVTKAGIMVFSPQVGEPVAVRYAFDDFVIGELYNTEGLPASSFRTDDW